MSILQILLGVVLLYGGAEALMRGGVVLAQKFRLSTLLTGFLTVGCGVSLPQLVVVLHAGMTEHFDLALGTVVGSNIANVLLVLGVSSIICPMVVEKKVAEFDGHFLVMMTFILAFIAWAGQAINPVEGLLLLIFLLIYTLLAFFLARKQHDAIAAGQVQLKEGEVLGRVVTLPLAGMMAGGGIVALLVGAYVLVRGVIGLSQWFAPEGTVALTIVALGTSVPALMTALMAARRKQEGVVIGTVLTSNIFNIAGILGITAFMEGISVSATFLAFDIWVMVATAFCLFLIMKARGKIDRITGAALVLGYIAYVGWQFS
ncbi:MAG: yrbG 2 [Rickettsiales bacterium]|jgi:cation:H+ antiporter|nr:yrbG 2 [Rickettsiales bacterium]